MDLKKLAVGAIVSSISLSGSAQQLHEMDEKLLFKNYALTMCIASEYRDSEIYDDSVKALNGYRDFADTHLDAYSDLTVLLSEWQVKPYSSKSGETVEIARCIDFHNSPEVNKIFQKYAAKQSSNKDKR